MQIVNKKDFVDKYGPIIKSYIDNLYNKIIDDLYDKIETEIFLSQIPEVSKEEQEEIEKLYGDKPQNIEVGFIDYVELGNVENYLQQRQ